VLGEMAVYIMQEIMASGVVIKKDIDMRNKDG
jgi:hypothetical protein